MNFQFSFKHMETSEALESYAEEKLRERILKYVTKPIEAHIVFSVEKHQHTAHCSVKAGDGFGIEVEHTCGDMYGSVDHMADKLAAQLKKQKEKLKDHKSERSVKSLRLNEDGVAIPSVRDDLNESVDAADIIKFEASRRRANAR